MKMPILNLGQPAVTTRSNILDISIPEQMRHNVKTGWKFIDELFAGDGITPSTVALITGQPGGGKTTLSLQLADSVTQKGHVALFNTGEESLYQVKRVVERLRLRSGFIPAYETYVQDIVKKARQVQRENPRKQLFLFVDSLQVIEYNAEGQATLRRGRGRPPGVREINVARVLAEWAKETYGIVCIIGQVTKKGEFAGRMGLKHIIDCHLHMEFANMRRARELQIDPGTRIAMMEKNRFGPAGQTWPYDILERGVQFSEHPTDYDEEEEEE